MKKLTIKSIIFLITFLILIGSLAAFLILLATNGGLNNLIIYIMVCFIISCICCCSSCIIWFLDKDNTRPFDGCLDD
jgi:uncharacterized membrane protein